MAGPFRFVYVTMRDGDVSVRLDGAVPRVALDYGQNYVLLGSLGGWKNIPQGDLWW